MDNNELQLQIYRAEQSRFDEALREAYNQKWWRLFITLITERRQRLMEDICSGELDPRKELIAKGQQSEDAFILLLDKQAEQLKLEERDNERRQRE